MANIEEIIGKVVLDLSCYKGSDLYCEGAVEDELLQIVKEHEPSEFNQIIRDSKSWSYMYHLSHVRGNILGWVPELENADVLEIGAGCGAVTWTIAEHAHSVTCVELSKKRSLINAYRNKEKGNINIKVGNFEDIEKTLTQKYDVITLIGVLEYAQSYINAERPYHAFLSMLKKHLKEDGKVIVAIENKFGLKYWAGCKEDHLGTYFGGIEGYTEDCGVKTFSKVEIEKLLDECGYSQRQFYYPYPDYKLPSYIYSDERLPQEGELNLNTRNFDADRMEIFNESEVYDNLIASGMFPFFSNSFLIFATGGNN